VARQATFWVTLHPGGVKPHAAAAEKSSHKGSSYTDCGIGGNVPEATRPARVPKCKPPARHPRTVRPVHFATPLPANKPRQASTCTGDMVEAHHNSVHPLLGPATATQIATRAAQPAANGSCSAMSMVSLLMPKPISRVGLRAFSIIAMALSREHWLVHGVLRGLEHCRWCPCAVAAQVRW
jgi:hypothetical protein